MSSGDTALHIENLSKSFGRIRAIDGLSLEVYPGEMVGFLGPNGAGKSTTLYTITGLVHPSSGKVEVLGHDLHSEFRKAMSQVGAMVEAPVFYEYLTARKNLELFGRLRGGVSKAQIDDTLEHVGLTKRGKDKVQTYSQGMKQRLGVGTALLRNPRLLLLDEPTNGMDPEGTREMLTLLRQRVREDRVAVFLSSHLLYEVEEYCDRVMVIDKGHLVASGKVSDILTPHGTVVQVSFSGGVPSADELMAEDGIADVTGISDGACEITLSNRDSTWLNEFLVGRGCRVSALVPKQKTLREFFLSITGQEDHENHDSRSATQ